MKNRNTEHSNRDAHSKLIGDLWWAIEELVSRRKKPKELEGIIAEARSVAAGWTINESSGHRRVLFDDTVNPTPLLLAALVVAMRSDYQLVQRLRTHVPDLLEYLADKSAFAEVQTLVSALPRSEPQLTPRQKY